MNQIQEKTEVQVPLRRRVLQGMTLSAVLQMLLFSFGVNQIFWPWWRMGIVGGAVVIAGALGGSIFYFLDPMRSKGGWNKAVAIMLSTIAYILLLLTAFVIAMNKTDY